MTLRVFYKEDRNAMTKFAFDKREFVVFVEENLAIVGLNVNNVDDRATQRAVQMVASVKRPTLKTFVFFD